MKSKINLKYLKLFSLCREDEKTKSTFKQLSPSKKKMNLNHNDCVNYN